MHVINSMAPMQCLYSYFCNLNCPCISAYLIVYACVACLTVIVIIMCLFLNDRSFNFV